MSSHINGKVLKFKKQLEQEGFCIDMRDNCWRIYKIGQPFYAFHPAEKGIQPCMRWVKATYKIDLKPRQQKSKNISKNDDRQTCGKNAYRKYANDFHNY